MSRDERGRLLPGSVPGWGMNWWMVDVAGVSPAQFAALTPSGRLALVRRFWRAAGRGWQPAVAPADWVGPHDPFDSPAPGDPVLDGPRPSRATATSDPWLGSVRRAIKHGPADPECPDREIRGVLSRGLTPAGVERWFELPNHHLDGGTPSDVLADDPRAVLRAAWDLTFGDG